jgi:hypothetical protein
MLFRLKTEENLKTRALKDVNKLESAAAKNIAEKAATSKMMLDKSASVLQLRGEVHTNHSFQPRADWFAGEGSQ